jgi:hypothetical protein
MSALVSHYTNRGWRGFTTLSPQEAKAFTVFLGVRTLLCGGRLAYWGNPENEEVMEETSIKAGRVNTHFGNRRYFGWEVRNFGGIVLTDIGERWCV